MHDEPHALTHAQKMYLWLAMIFVPPQAVDRSKPAELPPRMAKLLLEREPTPPPPPVVKAPTTPKPEAATAPTPSLNKPEPARPDLPKAAVAPEARRPEPNKPPGEKLADNARRVFRLEAIKRHSGCGQDNKPENEQCGKCQVCGEVGASSTEKHLEHRRQHYSRQQDNEDRPGNQARPRENPRLIQKPLHVSDHDAETGQPFSLNSYAAAAVATFTKVSSTPRSMSSSLFT